MPLHDWSTLTGWEGVHLLWMTELLRHVKANLPAGYRAYLGSSPAIAVGAAPARPDLSVRSAEASATNWVDSSHGAGSGETPGPDVEIAVAAMEADLTLMVERQGRLIAALELISPRNKDRPLARTTYGRRYCGYLLAGIHLMLVDVHARPIGFSFADQIARELDIPAQPAFAPPMAISYRVGEPAATGGRLLAIWRRNLPTAGFIPSLPLALAVDQSVNIDLEATYMRAAADAYLT